MLEWIEKIPLRFFDETELSTTAIFIEIFSESKGKEGKVYLIEYNISTVMYGYLETSV